MNLRGYLIYNRSQFLCNFHFLMWLLLQMPCPVIGPFIFKVLDCHYQFMDPGQVLCVRLIMPCKNFRQLPWCCVEWLLSYLARWLPCIWITALQKLIYVIKVVQYFLSYPDWPARYWQAQYYSFSSIHSYPSQCGRWLSVTGIVASEVAFSSSHYPSRISTLGSARGGSVGILMYHSMSALLHLWKSTVSGGLGVDCVQLS